MLFHGIGKQVVPDVLSLGHHVLADPTRYLIPLSYLLPPSVYHPPAHRRTRPCSTEHHRRIPKDDWTARGVRQGSYQTEAEVIIDEW